MPAQCVTRHNFLYKLSGWLEDLHFCDLKCCIDMEFGSIATNDIFMLLRRSPVQ